MLTLIPKGLTMHPPIDPYPLPDDSSIYLQIDGTLRGPVRQTDETTSQGLFVLGFGPVMPDEPHHLIGEAILIDQLTGQTRNIECLNVGYRDGCYQVLCADLGLQPSDESTLLKPHKTNRLDDFLLQNNRMLSGVRDVLVSSREPQNEPAFVRFTLDTDTWRLLGLQRDSCAHCDSQPNGPCESPRIDRRAMRSVAYPPDHYDAPDEHRIELLELAHKRRCLLEPVAITSERFPQVRLLARIRAVYDLSGKNLK